jgi:hypothetical protein
MEQAQSDLIDELRMAIASINELTESLGRIRATISPNPAAFNKGPLLMSGRWG